ncbi:hypothetical protein MesoLjLb_52450 [Mesorhizobium sp. L-8-3]|nr:hypothetical protein MesoLjLb_52450 [Mesorhizobium sp. L-8-3]
MSLGPKLQAKACLPKVGTGFGTKTRVKSKTHSVLCDPFSRNALQGIVADIYAVRAGRHLAGERPCGGTSLWM